MGCHLDDGEKDQTSPIISFNIGLSCIFLIGGVNKTEKPLAVLLESGDVCVMSGFSRKCYHGVPRIIKNSFEMNESEIEDIKNLRGDGENKDYNVY